MALNPESKEIRQALNQFPDKIFAQVVGMPIRSSANLISNPEQSTAVRQNPRSIADPFASLIAFCNDLQNPDPAILKDCIYVLKTMYAMVADADYRGVSVTYTFMYSRRRTTSTRAASNISRKEPDGIRCRTGYL